MPMTPIPAEPGKKLDWIINTWAESRVVEPIVCEDGHILSVQADGGHYCHDANGVDDRWRRDDQPLALPVRSVEVQTKDAPANWDERNIERPGEGGDTYGWIAVEEVRAFIASHGGEKGAGETTQLDRIEALLERIVENTTPATNTLTMTSTTISPEEMLRTLNRLPRETP